MWTGAGRSILPGSAPEMPERASGGYPSFRRTVTGSRLYPGLRAGSMALSMASFVMTSTAWRRGASGPDSFARRS
jgi:hypothetical protein